MTELVLGIDASRARRGAREFERHTDRVTRSARGATGQVGRMEGSFSRLKTAAFAVGGALAAIGIVQFGRAITNAALEMERITRAMNAVSSSAEEANAEFAFVRKETQRLGLDLATSAKQFVQLRAAAKGTSLEGQNVRDIFTSVGEASLALGLNAEQTAGALNALQQIISKGNVSAEELRQQLGERLPGAFRLAAESIGVTTAELNKMLEMGELTAEELLPNLADTLTEKFGKAAEEAGDSAQAAFGRFNTAMFELKATLGQELLPELTKVAETLQDDLTDPKVVEGLKAITGAFASMLTVVTDLSREIGELSQAFSGTIPLNPQNERINELQRERDRLLEERFRNMRTGRSGIAQMMDRRIAEVERELNRLGVSPSLSGAFPAGGASLGIRGAGGFPASKQASETLSLLEKIDAKAREMSQSGAGLVRGGNPFEAYGEAAESANEEIRVSGELLEKIDRQANRMADDASGAMNRLSFTFSSAFEDAIVQGENLRNVMRGLLQDIIRIMVRVNLSEPLGQALAAAVAGGFSSTPSGLAGTGGSAGPNAGLVQSASGNLFTSPSVTSIAEGGRPEAVLPLERRGGQLGVRSSGGGNNITIDARGADKAAIVRLERAIMNLNRSIEPRAVQAIGEARARG